MADRPRGGPVLASRHERIAPCEIGGKHGINGRHFGPAHAKAFTDRFDNSDESWRDQTILLLRDAGFNDSGMASLDATNRQFDRPLVYAPQLQLMSSFGRAYGGIHQVSGHLAYRGEAPYIFHPGFADYVQEQIDERVKPLADDPWLLG